MKNNFFALPLLFLPFLFSSFHAPETGSSSIKNQPLVCNLPAPASISGTVIGSPTPGVTVDLSWSAVSGAAAYSLLVTDNGSPFLQTTVAGTSRYLTGLTSGHTYRCYVGAMCDFTQTSSYIIGLDLIP